MPPSYCPSMLAQAAPVAPLDGASDPFKYLFENPWPLVLLLAGAGIVAYWYLNRAARREAALRTGAILIGLAAAVYLISALVTTRREFLGDRARDLIALTAAADTAELQSMLAPEVNLRLLGNTTQYSRGQILDLVHQNLRDRYPIKSHSVSSLQVRFDSTTVATIQARVHARVPEATMYDAPIGSWWRLGWRLDGDRWVVHSIECLQIDGVSQGTNITP